MDPAAYAKGMIKLAPDNLPIEKCAYISDEYNLAAGDRSASSMAELIATLPHPPGIEIRTISYGEERPLEGYPRTGTAGEFNRIGRGKNGIRIVLIEAVPGGEPLKSGRPRIR